MGRPASIWFSDTRGEAGYFTGFKGLKRRLTYCDSDDKPHGPNYRKAEAAFDELRKRLEVPDPKDQSFGIVLERYFRHLEEGNATTGRAVRSLLRDLGKRMEHMDVSEVSQRQLEQYIKTRPTWCDSTRAHAHASLKACFTWNVSAGHCTFNPLEKVKADGGYEVAARGEEYVLPHDLEQLLLKQGSQPWRDLAIALSLTGARPGELAGATRTHYNAAKKIIVLTEWKNAKKLKRKDKRRIIHVPDQVAEVIARNLKAGDLLFPTRHRRRYSGARIWQTVKESLCKKSVAAWMRDNAHDEWRVMPYSFRHSYATKAIFRKVPLALLADLMGTSIEVIQTNYSHALGNVDAMRDAYLQSIGQ